MASTKPIKLGIAQKLRNRKYRTAFFKARAQDDVASALRALRRKRELKQKKLAELCDMRQSAISRIEQAEYSAWNFTTLLRVAEALDAKVSVTFEAAEDVIKRYDFMERENAPQEVTQVGANMAELNAVASTGLVVTITRTAKAPTSVVSRIGTKSFYVPSGGAND